MASGRIPGFRARRVGPTPIIESRVTSPASSFSLIPSVPAGRFGSTQYRISELESQIRISTLSGMS